MDLFYSLLLRKFKYLFLLPQDQKHQSYAMVVELSPSKSPPTYGIVNLMLVSRGLSVTCAGC